MAKKKAKTRKKVTAKKAVKKKRQKENKVSKYGHILSAQSGFIDQQLEANKPLDAIVASWNKGHPENPIKPGRVVGHIKHLMTEHGLNKKTAGKVLRNKAKS